MKTLDVQDPLTAAEALRINGRLALLARRDRALAHEVVTTFAAQCDVLERAITDGGIHLDHRTARQVEALSHGIADRLADRPAER
jgi:hypothetical protein